MHSMLSYWKAYSSHLCAFAFSGKWCLATSLHAIDLEWTALYWPVSWYLSWYSRRTALCAHCSYVQHIAHRHPGFCMSKSGKWLVNWEMRPIFSYHTVQEFWMTVQMNESESTVISTHIVLLWALESLVIPWKTNAIFQQEEDTR